MVWVKSPTGSVEVGDRIIAGDDICLARGDKGKGRGKEAMSRVTRRG